MKWDPRWEWHLKEEALERRHKSRLPLNKSTSNSRKDAIYYVYPKQEKYQIAPPTQWEQQQTKNKTRGPSRPKSLS